MTEVPRPSFGSTGSSWRARPAGVVAVVAICLIATATVLVACGDDSESSSSTSDAKSSTTDSGTGDDESTTTTAGGTGELAGEPFDNGPAAGEALAVVGVAYDDVLNVRALPGADEGVVTDLTPTDTDLVATGQARLLPESIWYEVEAGGETGWVNAHYVAHLGDTTDITAEVRDSGVVPSIVSEMEELGTSVASAVTAPVDGGEGNVETVMVVEPSTGDLGEVTYDVIGYADDALYGQRLHVFGTPGEGGGFDLKTVESTLLCRRGVSSGLCT